MSETQVAPLSDDEIADLRWNVQGGIDDGTPTEVLGRSFGYFQRLLATLDAANADRARLQARVSDLEAELQEAREERNATERDRDAWAEAANTAAAAAYRELLTRRAVLDWHHRERPQNGCPPSCAQLFGPDSYHLTVQAAAAQAEGG